MTRAIALCWLCASPLWAIDLVTADGGLRLALDDEGRVVELDIDSRPAPTVGDGGWELLDQAGGTDESYFFGLAAAWEDGNSLGFAGPRWRLGRGWQPLEETFNGGPVARCVDPAGGYSDALRFRLEAAAEAVYTVTLYVRVNGFAGTPRMGVLPVNAVGQPTGRLQPLDWARAAAVDGLWQPVGCVLQAGATTALLELHIALEEAAGTFDVGGVAVTFHGAGARIPLRGTVAASGDGAEFAAADDGLRLTARYRPLVDAILVDAELTAADGEDHAVVLTFRLPLDGAGWDWWQTLRDRRQVPAGGGHLLANLRQLGGHVFSPYPLGCVSRAAPAQALALATPLAQAVVTRHGFRQEEGLQVAFDLGLSPRLGQSSARLRLAILAPPAAWGMRGALQTYYGLYEDDVIRRCPRAGAWFTAANPEAIANPARLGLLFDEQAAAHPAWTRANDLMGLAGLLPWGRFERTDADRLARGNGLYPVGLVGTGRGPEVGHLLDADGAPVELHLGDGLVFAPWWTDPDLLPDGPAAELNAALAGRLQGPDGQPLAGVMLDAVGAGWAGWWLDTEREEHLRAATQPLTFSSTVRRPVAWAAVGHGEYLRFLSQRLRPNGQILLGNLDPEAPLPFIAPWLDVLGAGERRPSDDELMWLRVVGYQKPLTFLDSTVIDPGALRAEQRDVWHQALLWGAFPGAAGWLTSRNLALHEPFFEVFVPVLRELAAAGWQPVPHAFVSDAGMELERYGFRDDLYLVLRNRAGTPRNVTLTVYPNELGLVTVNPDGLVMRRLLFVDRLSRTKRPIELRITNDRWQTSLLVPPSGVMVLTPYKVDTGFEMLTNFDLLPAP